MPTGALVGVLEAHYLRVAHVRFSEDGSAFVSASDDGQALIWSLPTYVPPPFSDILAPAFEM